MIEDTDDDPRPYAPPFTGDYREVGYSHHGSHAPVIDHSHRKHEPPRTDYPRIPGYIDEP